jgi:hypothetical protein
MDLLVEELIIEGIALLGAVAMTLIPLAAVRIYRSYRSDTDEITKPEETHDDFKQRHGEFFPRVQQSSSSVPELLNQAISTVTPLAVRIPQTNHCEN